MEKETQMLKMAEQWKTSGKSRIEFAREHNITIHSLNYWCKKLRRRDSARQPEPKFIELNTLGAYPQEKRGVQVELELPGGIILRIY